jgi:Zn-dependent membrane protease YugP
MLFLFDWTFLLLIPALILAVWAQMRVRSAYQKYSRVRASCGMTGAELALDMIRRDDLLSGVAVGGPARAGESASALRAVNVQMVPGTLTDNYDPSRKVLNLSEGVYSSDSIAALGVAAHETGHAVQDAGKFPALVLRSTLGPAAQIGTTAAFPLFLLGFFFAASGLRVLMDLGIWVYSAAVAFTLVTLPVELDASRRALRMLRDGGYVTAEEEKGTKAVLTAAALTYVAAAAMAAMTLIRLVILRGERD